MIEINKNSRQGAHWGKREISTTAFSLLCTFSLPPLKLNSEDHHDKLLCFQRGEDAGGDLKAAGAFLRCLRSAPGAKEMKGLFGIWIPPGNKNHFIGQVHRSAFQARDGFYGWRMLKGERGKKSGDPSEAEPACRLGCPPRRGRTETGTNRVQRSWNGREHVSDTPAQVSRTRSSDSPHRVWNQSGTLLFQSL